ncbi:MAG: hypothetical protein HOC74_21340 [Gemmatimonadetes bacterium]|nr:hypothetical protein [Gemmatimonadota bacterium]
MSPALPPYPNLDHLKKQAKSLLKSFHLGDLQACRSFQKYLPRFSQNSDREILAARLSLHDAQYIVARKCGFDDWAALRQAIAEEKPLKQSNVPARAPTRDSLDERLQRHIDALGFHSVGSYRIWCHKQGFDKGFDKDDAQLQKERDRFQHQEETRRPDPKPDYRPHTVRIITATYEGKTRVSEGLAQAFDATADGEERQALWRLLVHCEKYAKTSGAASLARHHRDWLRPLEDWFPQSQSRKRQFSELVRYLFANYDVPLFMDSVWHQEDSPGARHQQAWFKHMGLGGNIRKLDTGITLTRRMAHLFLQAPGHYTVPMAMRRAQVLAMGGNVDLVKAVVGSRLRDFMEDEPFWETVVRFLANQPMLEPTYVGPIIDYIYNQKFVGRRIPGADGTFVQGKPPLPNMTMKGRSINKLLRQVDEWHEGLALDEHEDWVEWPSCGVRGYQCEEEDNYFEAPLHWSIVELCDSWALVQESQIMHHCVRTYIPRCVRGEGSVWSLQVAVGGEERQPVLTISMDNKRKVITEFRGKHNMQPNDKKRLARNHQLESSYLYLLQRSPKIMGQWMEREQLQHWQNYTYVDQEGEF